MITSVLSAIEPVNRGLGTISGIIMVFVILFFYVGFIVLIISLMIRLVRYLSTAGKERKLMRIELGKLAEEVQLLRQKLDDGENKNSQTRSE